MNYELTFQLVRLEVERARQRFGPFRNQHEGFAVIGEELCEVFDAIRANDPGQGVREAIQVAAMAICFATECDYPFDPNIKTR